VLAGEHGVAALLEAHLAGELDEQRDAMSELQQQVEDLQKELEEAKAQIPTETSEAE
jgi:uncharacterized protein involved in exopolysaccharide biosynthesis